MMFEHQSEKNLQNGSNIFDDVDIFVAEDRRNKSVSNLFLIDTKLDVHTVTSRHKGYKGKCEIPPLRTLDDFFDYPKIKGKMSCTNLAELGGNKREVDRIYPYNDGSRMVCLDKIKRQDCVVLSFGIGTDITFDLHVSKLLNCKVYMFDSTVEYDLSPLPPNMKFYKVGLYNQKGKLKINDKFYKVDRYENIIRKLNLANRTIDYLKLDIESSELEFFQDIFGPSFHLLGNIRQIGMEIHPCIFSEIEGQNASDVFQPFWDVMHRLDCHGFDLISFIPNLYPLSQFTYGKKGVQGCYDLEYLRRE